MAKFTAIFKKVNEVVFSFNHKSPKTTFPKNVEDKFKNIVGMPGFIK
jgi:hypothetical protein